MDRVASVPPMQAAKDPFTTGMPDMFAYKASALSLQQLPRHPACVLDASRISVCQVKLALTGLTGQREEEAEEGRSQRTKRLKRLQA